jgi:dTDP-4-dehydrorhamnose 3,5-epimerase
VRVAVGVRIEQTGIEGVRIITPDKFGDERGFFSETWNRTVLESLGVRVDFVQDNHAFSATRGTLRGLHFQAPPAGQTKLVRVSRGAVLDVAVDIRRGSPTYGRHVAVELSGKNWRQLLVPVGFAHGYCTLEENTEVLYKVDGPYAPAAEGGLLWNDPALGIAWPGFAGSLVSERDTRWPALDRLESPFSWGGA